MYGTRIYKSWAAMKERCLNSNCKSYKNYGGRGIIICFKWLKFEDFYRDMGDRPKGKSLDRIDNNGNYCKENCKWSTRKEQQNNMRRNHLITFNSKNQTMSQWSEELGIKYGVLKSRINQYNWSIKRALNQ